MPETMDDLLRRIAELEVALRDAVDALELANSLLAQKPYAIPLSNQFNARHAAAERARAALQENTDAWWACRNDL